MCRWTSGWRRLSVHSYSHNRWYLTWSWILIIANVHYVRRLICWLGRHRYYLNFKQKNRTKMFGDMERKKSVFHSNSTGRVQVLELKYEKKVTTKTNYVEININEERKISQLCVTCKSLHVRHITHFYCFDFNTLFIKKNDRNEDKRQIQTKKLVIVFFCGFFPRRTNIHV